MTDYRKHDTKNYAGTFNLHINSDGTWPIEKVQAALIADVLKELQKLNRLLHCPNTTDIPRILRSIDRRLATLEKKTRKRRAKR